MSGHRIGHCRLCGKSKRQHFPRPHSVGLLAALSPCRAGGLGGCGPAVLPAGGSRRPSSCTRCGLWPADGKCPDLLVLSRGWPATAELWFPQASDHCILMLLVVLCLRNPVRPQRLRRRQEKNKDKEVKQYFCGVSCSETRRKQYLIIHW